jgi:hypothetical protein
MLAPLLLAVVGILASLQVPSPAPVPRPAVQKLGPDLYQIGPAIRVDTAKREVSVSGRLNEGVEILEFVANTMNGAKAYESALTLHTDAISFNAALLLIGLDPARGKPSKRQFDTEPPAGDPVDIIVEAKLPTPRQFRVEELLFDNRTKTTIPPGPWVYTGSTMIDSGLGPKYLAELDGVVIGLMHGPQAIIDNPRNDAVHGYGSIVLNPKLGVLSGSPVTVTVKALNSTVKRNQ